MNYFIQGFYAELGIKTKPVAIPVQGLHRIPLPVAETTFSIENNALIATV
jgi:hypothetical protein